MLTGHFAIAFIGKRAEGKLSLGTLVFACLLSDFLWCVFMIRWVGILDESHPAEPVNINA